MAGYGFEPVRHLTGGEVRVNSAGVKYTFASGYATNLFYGDPVAMAGTGTIARAAAGTGNTILGIFAGVSYTASNGEKKFSKNWVASTAATDIVAYVYDDPFIVFKAQADQDTTALAAASVGENCALGLGGGGSALTGISSAVIDSSTKVATTEQFRILGSAALDGSFTAAGTTMDVYVMINEHFYKGTAGV